MLCYTRKKKRPRVKPDAQRLSTQSWSSLWCYLHRTFFSKCFKDYRIQSHTYITAQHWRMMFLSHLGENRIEPSTVSSPKPKLMKVTQFVKIFLENSSIHRWDFTLLKFSIISCLQNIVQCQEKICNRIFSLSKSYFMTHKSTSF